MHANPLNERLLPTESTGTNLNEASPSLARTIRDTFFYIARETTDSMGLAILIVLCLQTYSPQWLEASSCAAGNKYGEDRTLMMFLGVFLFDIFGLRNIPAAMLEDYQKSSRGDDGFFKKLVTMKRSDWAKLRLIPTAHRVVSAWRLGEDYQLLTGLTSTAMTIACYPIMKFTWDRMITSLGNTEFAANQQCANYLKKRVKNITQKQYVAMTAKIMDTVLDAIGQAVRSASAFHLLANTVGNMFVLGESDDDAPYQYAMNIFLLTMVFMGIVIGLVANLLTKFSTSRLQDSQKHVQGFEQAMAIFVACMVTLMGVAICNSIQLLSGDYYRDHGLPLAGMSAFFGISSGIIAYSGTLDKPKQQFLRGKVTAMLQGHASIPAANEGRIGVALRWAANSFTKYVTWLHHPTTVSSQESSILLQPIKPN